MYVIDTIQLNTDRFASIVFSENTQLALDGRPVRRAVLGGRVFRIEGNNLLVRLDTGEFRDQELTLTPPVNIVVNENRTCENVSKLRFFGETMQIHTNEDPKQKEAMKQLAEQIQIMTEEENRLRLELQKKEAVVRQLEQDNQTEKQHINQLQNSANALQQQKNQLIGISGTITQLTANLEKVQEQLDKAQNEETILNESIALKSQERKIVDAAIRKLEEDLDRAITEYEEKKQKEDRLNEDLKKYGPNVIDALNNEIQTMSEQFAKAEEEWLALSGEKRVWDKRLKDQQNANNERALEISQQPEELRKLQEAYEALTRRLTETVHAQEMCSEEKQKALKEQINEQEPIAQKLTEQYHALEQHADELTRTMDELRKAQDDKLLELYPQMRAGLDEIMRDINSMNDEMASLQESVDQFDQNINACAERMERLKEWYHVDQTPLQKLQERLGELNPIENEQLLRTMNPVCVERVRLLFENVETNLNELDQILKDVIKAAQSDEKFINLKVSTNEQYARQEMKR